MKNLLITLSFIMIAFTGVNAQTSILDWKIGDKIDTTGYSHILALPAIEYKRNKFDNIDTWTQTTYYSHIAPKFELTKDSILTQMSFKFAIEGYNGEQLLKAFYDKLKKVDGIMFWNHDTDNRYYKDNRDGTFIDIVLKDNFIEISKTQVPDK